MCLYIYEILENHTLAAKSYLLLSSQQHHSGKPQSSASCMQKAKDIVFKKTSLKKIFVTKFLKTIGEEWLNKIIRDIPGNDYFNILLKENRLKTIAYRLKKEVQKEAQEYNDNPKKIKGICEAFKEAIKYLNFTCNYIKKNNNTDYHQLETDIHELQKEYFQFKLNSIIGFYLPENSDQSLFQTSISSWIDESDFFIDKKASIDKLLKEIYQIPEENRSFVDHFKCAYVCEFLEDPISASQHYFLLSKKYLQNENPKLSVECLERANNLIRETAKAQFNNILIANFLEQLDVDFLDHLDNQVYNDNSCKFCKNYLNKILIEKKGIRKAFEGSLSEIEKHSNNESPRCFICFNVDEPDVKKWLSNTLISDLKRIGVGTIFAPNELKIGADLNNFQGQIRETEFVIIASTPLLKKKFDKRNNAPAGSTFEIKLASERLKEPEKYETTYLIYLKGDHQSSCPSTCFEPFFGQKLNIEGKNTDFDYYFHILNFFATMRKVNEKKLEKIKNDFKSKVNDVLTKTVNIIKNKKMITDTKKHNDGQLEDILFNHLKKIYCSQTEIKTLIEERKLSIEETYVRLAMITEEKDNGNKEKRNEIQKPPEDDHWLTYETIYDFKESIKLEELFQHKKIKENKAKRVIFFGAAGVGKTTCFHYIAYEWANGRLWNEFKAVFWICLRNLNVDSYPSRYEGYDAYDLIAKECKVLSKECNLDLSTFHSLLEDESFRSNTLLVLDGYDELPFAADRGHLSDSFQQLEKIFPHILISSRPQLVLFIENPVKMEILGFDQKGAYQYIGKFYDQISKTSELSSGKLQKRLEDLHDLLKQKQLIRSLSCIPINLELICCLYFFEEEIDANELTTITSLYSHIINWLYKRFLLKPGVNQRATANIHRRGNLHDHSQIKPLASKLEEIAWHGMKEQIRDFNRSKLENKFYLDVDIIGSLGLLPIKNKIANFIHVAFQEYFAAVYLANYYIQGESKTIKEDFTKNKLNSRYALVFEMTAGYLSSLDEIEALQKFFDDLISEPYDLAVNYELNLLARCFEECKNPSIIKQYAKFVEFVAGYIQNNWFINNHYIAQLLSHNPGLLSQEKIYQVILGVIDKCKKIILDKQYNELPYEFSTDFIANTHFLENTESKHVLIKVTDFLIEIARDSHILSKYAINIFADAIKNADEDIRRRAANALFEICRSEKAYEETVKDVVRTLKEALKDADEDVRWNASNALGEICRSSNASEETLKDVVQTLNEALSDSSQHVRKCAVNALGEICLLGKASEDTLKGVLKALGEALICANEDIGNNAANALGEICCSDNTLEWIIRDVIKVFAKALSDANEHCRRRAADALGKIRLSNQVSEDIVKSVLKALKDALSDADHYVRGYAANALGKICLSNQVSEDTLKGAVRALSEALIYAREDIGSNAANALGDICHSDNASEEIIKDVIKTLTDALSYADKHVRMSIVNALDKICLLGKTSEKSVNSVAKAFEKILGDADEHIRRHVPYALGEICRSENVSKDTLDGVVKALAKVLSNADKYAREPAADALGKICRSGNVSEDTLDDVVNALTNSLSNADKYAREPADALGEICRSGNVFEDTLDDVVKAIIKVLSNADKYAREPTADALVEICLARRSSEGTLEDVVKALNVSLSNKDTYARGNAANVLVKICLAKNISEDTLKEAVEAFTKALNYADEHVKRHATNALGDICRSGIVSEETVDGVAKALTKALNDADEHVRRHAANVLGDICRSGIVSEETVDGVAKALTKALNDADEHVRRHAANVLGEICRAGKVSEDILEDVAKALTKALSDTDEHVKRHATNALSEICRSGKIFEDTLHDVVKALNNALNNADEHVKRHAINVLGEICRAEKVSEDILDYVVKVLAEALINTNAAGYVREYFANALGEICQSGKVSADILDEVVKTLAEALINTNVAEYVREYSANALDEIFRSGKVSENILDGMVKALAEALNNTDAGRYVRGYAASALGEICRSGKVFEDRLDDVVKALTKALCDEAEYVRNNGFKALCNIEQADKVFSELVLNNVNIIHCLKNKDYIDYLLKNVNILGSIDTCKYVIKLCHCTDYIFSYSNQKICIAGKEHLFDENQLTFDLLKEAYIFEMVVWRK